MVETAYGCLKKRYTLEMVIMYLQRGKDDQAWENGNVPYSQTSQCVSVGRNVFEHMIKLFLMA